MTWLYLALFAPFMFAISGFIDKYALSKVAADASAGALIILSGICCLPIVVIFGFLDWHDIASASLGSSLLAVLAGTVQMIGWYFYFRALDGNFFAAQFWMYIANCVVAFGIFLTGRAPQFFTHLAPEAWLGA